MRKFSSTTTASVPYWDGSRVLFDIVDGSERQACAISAMALEEISGKRCFRTAALLACFSEERARIERIALEKFRARPEGVSGRLSVWADDVEDLPDGGLPVEATQSLACAGRA